MQHASLDRVGVLFDVDGTLVDNSYLHTVAWWQAFRDSGHEATMARLHRHIGMGDDTFLPTLLGTEDEAASKAHSARYDVFWDGMQPIPGAAALLRELHRRGAVVMLASSADEASLKKLRAIVDADDAIDGFACASDVSTSKPAPDIFAAALAKSDLPASAAVAIGDTVWDVEAAARCGLPCIAVESGGIDAAELTAAGAVAVYRDCAALLEGLDDSPLGALLRQLGGVPG